LEEIETRKPQGATIRSKAKWNKVGNKYSISSLSSLYQKNSNATILEIKDKHGRGFSKRETWINFP
jgi:hypothetical protein